MTEKPRGPSNIMPLGATLCFGILSTFKPTTSPRSRQKFRSLISCMRLVAVILNAMKAIVSAMRRRVFLLRGNACSDHDKQKHNQNFKSHA